MSFKTGKVAFLLNFCLVLGFDRQIHLQKSQKPTFKIAATKPKRYLEAGKLNLKSPDWAPIKFSSKCPRQFIENINWVGVGFTKTEFEKLVWSQTNIQLISHCLIILGSSLSLRWNLN